jgi:phage-related minor tail protein
MSKDKNKEANVEALKTETPKSKPKHTIVKAGTILALLRNAKTDEEIADAIAHAETHKKKFGKLNPGSEKLLLKMSLNQ